VTRLTPARAARVLALLLAGLACVSLLAISLGSSSLSLAGVLSTLFGQAPSAAASDIVWRVRLPRVLLGGCVGAALASAGALFQGLLRNPLADPFVLGISGGAALAGVAVLGVGSSLGLSHAAVPPAAFAGALAACALLYAIAGSRGRGLPGALLLTGVVFNAIASAAIVFVASVAGMAEGTSIFLWLIGSLSAARAPAIGFVAGLLAAGLAIALPASRNLNLLALGEESARQLGVDVEREQRRLLFATALMVGAAVSVSGLVGFVGLIVPHCLRLTLGPDHRLLVPASALAGAAFLILCDTAARSLLPGRELPVGAITALAGGPLFLWLLRRESGRGWLL
jgi:iron complex transport system permease protein